MANELTDQQTHQLRVELEHQFTELWSEIGAELEGSAKERFQQIAGEVRDRGDESLADMLTDLNMTLVDKHVQETRDINSALTRIDKGIYGTCEDCDKPIGFERLTAYPTATRCIHCQEAYEKPRQPGTHTQL